MTPIKEVLTELLPFQIAGRRGALLVEDVVEVLRAVAITPLPSAPHLVEGVVDVRGQIIPVIDLRARFGLPARKIALADRLIIVRGETRLLAMHVDAAGTILTIPSSDIEFGSATPLDRGQLRGVCKLGNGLTLIYDAQSFLSEIEEEELGRALAERPSR